MIDIRKNIPFTVTYDSGINGFESFRAVCIDTDSEHFRAKKGNERNVIKYLSGVNKGKTSLVECRWFDNDLTKRTIAYN